jgi:hypothetical protein
MPHRKPLQRMIVRANLPLAPTTPVNDWPSTTGEWGVSVLRAELGLARRIAETLLSEAEVDAPLPDMAVARRMMGLTCYLRGAFIEAKDHIEKALKVYDDRWDRDTKIHVNHDTGSAATIYLAVVSWIVGEVAGTQKLAEKAIVRAVGLDHVRTLVTIYNCKAQFEVLCQRVEAAKRDAETLDPTVFH